MGLAGGCPPSPLMGRMSCGQEEKTTKQSISARRTIQSPGEQTVGRNSSEFRSSPTGMFMKMFQEPETVKGGVTPSSDRPSTMLSWQLRW